MVFSVADGVLPSATFYESKGKSQKTKVFHLLTSTEKDRRKKELQCRIMFLPYFCLYKLTKFLIYNIVILTGGERLTQ